MIMHALKAARLAASAAALSLMVAVGPAAAGCYEAGVDCTDDHNIPKDVLRTMTCDSLWSLRNSIYNEHGYCFKTSQRHLRSSTMPTAR